MAKVKLGSRSSARWSVLRRMVLRRADGVAYLDRIRLVQTPWFGVYLHRFDAPDPGMDLHDHPWPFVTMVLSGGYTEVRCDSRWASPGNRPGGCLQHRRRFRPKVMRLTEAHTIVELDRLPTRSLVIVGRRQREWGFYEYGRWTPHAEYDDTRHHLVYQEDR